MPVHQVLMNIAQDARRGVVDAGDRLGIDDEPFDRRGGALDEAPDVGDEAVNVGVEKVGAELEYYQAWPADSARDRGSRPPIAVVVDQYGSIRSITVANMTEQRQRHRQDNALFDADHDDHRCGDQRQLELA